MKSQTGTSSPSGFFTFGLRLPQVWTAALFAGRPVPMCMPMYMQMCMSIHTPRQCLLKTGPSQPN
jgi:hypothetical protein